MAKSLAYRPEPDAGERRKNLVIAGAIVAVILGFFLVRWLGAAASGVAVEVRVSGYGDQPLKALMVVKPEAGGEPVAKGESDPRTGLYSARIPPGVYVIRAEVGVKEGDFGFATNYPAEARAVVDAALPSPIKVPLVLEKVEANLDKPGQYRIHR